MTVSFLAPAMYTPVRLDVSGSDSALAVSLSANDNEASCHSSNVSLPLEIQLRPTSISLRNCGEAFPPGSRVTIDLVLERSSSIPDERVVVRFEPGSPRDATREEVFYLQLEHETDAKRL